MCACTATSKLYVCVLVNNKAHRHWMYVHVWCSNWVHGGQTVVRLKQFRLSKSPGKSVPFRYVCNMIANRFASSGSGSDPLHLISKWISSFAANWQLNSGMLKQHSKQIYLRAIKIRGLPVEATAAAVTVVTLLLITLCRDRLIKRKQKADVFSVHAVSWACFSVATD